MKCKLCEAIKNEKILFKFEDYIIISTKNMKGHHKRIMIVSNEHKKDLAPVEENHVKSVFILFCQNYFDEEPTFALVDSTYASIPDHWHKIACDWFGTEEELQQLHYTPHISIKTKKDWEPKKNYTCESCGSSFTSDEVKMGYCPECGRDSLKEK